MYVVTMLATLAEGLPALAHVLAAWRRNRRSAGGPVARSGSRRIALLLLPIALLASCADDPDETAARSTDKVLVRDAELTRSRPACPDVLAPGANLPEDLHEGGCLQGDGTILLPGVFVCDDGRELLVDNNLAGYLGGQATTMDAADEEYASLFEECHG